VPALSLVLVVAVVDTAAEEGEEDALTTTIGVAIEEAIGAATGEATEEVTEEAIMAVGAEEAMVHLVVGKSPAILVVVSDIYPRTVSKAPSVTIALELGTSQRIAHNPNARHAILVDPRATSRVIVLDRARNLKQDEYAGATTSRST